MYSAALLLPPPCAADAVEVHSVGGHCCTLGNACWSSASTEPAQGWPLAIELVATAADSTGHTTALLA